MTDNVFRKDVLQMGYRYKSKRTMAHLSKIAILGRRALFAFVFIIIGGILAVLLLGTWASGVTLSCEPTKFVQIGDQLGTYTVEEVLNDKQVLASCSDGTKYTLTVNGDRWLNSSMFYRMFTTCTVGVSEVQSSVEHGNYLAGGMGVGVLEAESRSVDTDDTVAGATTEQVSDITTFVDGVDEQVTDDTGSDTEYTAEEVERTAEEVKQTLDGVDPDSEYADALWELFYGD